MLKIISLIFKNESNYDLREEHLQSDKVMMWIILIHAFVAIFVTSQYYETYTIGIISSGLILTISGISYLTLAGTLYFRLIMAVSLMFFSAIFIQQHLGRIEMHFHVFIALAILTIYKDLIPMLLASLVTAIHHLFFNYLQFMNFTINDDPIKIFSYGCGIEYVLLHVVMVIAEALVLSYIILLSKNQFLRMKELQLQAEKNHLEAVSAEQVKTEFLANMSHEIRTPMNGIVGFTHLLQQTNLNNDQKRFVDIIETSTKTLLNIVNQILDFSKLKSDKVELDLTSINPFEEFEDSLMIFVPIAHRKEITFNINIDSSISECIVIDSLKLKQILTNLVSNAMKFTSSGGIVSVSIKKVSSSQNNQRLSFSVSDTGIGIPKSRQKRIFDAFTQVDSSTTRRFGGTGLGLNISASYVNLMGGKIEIESIEGKGSTFIFELNVSVCNPKQPISLMYARNEIIVSKEVLLAYPMLEDQLQQLKLAFLSAKESLISSFLEKSKDEKVVITNSRNYLNDWLNIRPKPKVIVLGLKDKKDTPSVDYIEQYDHSTSTLYNQLRKYNAVSGTNKNINTEATFNFDLYVLIAEDYPINQMLIGELLKSYSIKYDIAENGVEAVEMAMKNNYNLVLMDINMPEMNGIEATQKLREAFDDTLPIVALTANAAEGDKDYFISVGMDDYLSKPIDPTELENILRQFGNYQIRGKFNE
jgi:signal transduction histidine kinase/CheY-like chemotaxis protein